MSLKESLVCGVTTAYLFEGIDIDHIDWDNHILCVTLPKSSDAYLKGGIETPEDLAQRIKAMWIELGILPEDCKISYNIKDIHWTRRMGHENYEAKKDEVLAKLLSTLKTEMRQDFTE